MSRGIEYPVECPLMEEEINMDTCFDIHMVVCGEAPKWTAPEQIYNRPNYINICMQCINHRND